MNATLDTRIYELFNRDHMWFLDQLFDGQHADSFFDISPEIEVVFETDAARTTFRVAFGYSCEPGRYEQQLPSLRTSVGRQMVDDVINQLNMFNTAAVVERVRLICPDSRDHHRLQAALDAADAGAARSFSI